MSTKTVEKQPLRFLHGLFLFFLVFGLWLLLAGNLEAAELTAGMMVALIVTLASRPHLSILSGLIISPTAITPFIQYLGIFFIALVRANIDMARRVLTPSLPLRPAVVEVKTNLKSPLGRLILANSITLTPGTLTVDVQDQTLLIHWIDCPPDTDITTATQAITTQFERHMKGFVL